MHGVLDYLEASSVKFADKTAIACKDEKYTFSELRDAARKLARAVSALGIKNEPVGVLVTRSAQTAVLFLAAAYSENYYVPLDPAMPEKKRKDIIADSGMRLILGDEKNRGLVESSGEHIVFLSAADAADEMCAVPCVQEDTPLYLVYTSGSTGKPKGVLKSHGAMLSFIEAFSETFALGENEVIGNQTPFFFDASAKDIYLMLKTGATLEVIPSEMFMLPTALIEYMNQRAVTYICWVPTALSMVIQMNAFRKLLPTTLKSVFFVGEVFPLKQLMKWQETLPQLRYINLYGSSEIAGICCWFDAGGYRSESPLPMGKPLSNCRIFLRREDKTVTEQGEIGEICIESPALALCYYKDEERTAKSFVTERFDAGREMRVFYTGDLARYDENGDLVFVSRKDFQIKHLGKRIELGEIEAACDAIPEVERCCCLYDDTAKQIRMFCELAPGSQLDAKAIRNILKDSLSDYMVPQKVTVLESMPYNANGKIDRTRLKTML